MVNLETPSERQRNEKSHSKGKYGKDVWKKSGRKVRDMFGSEVAFTTLSELV